MKAAQVRIKGVTALLMHRFPLEPVEAIDKKSKEEQAKIAAYIDPETDELYIPGVAVQRALVNAATYSKGKGRASLQKTAAACLMVAPERISLGTKVYAIDSRAVVVPATKGRIIRHRPRLDNWQCKFEIEFDEVLLSEEQVYKIVNDAATRVGLLDFRPEHKGAFGRFMVTQWEVNGNGANR